MNSIYKKLCLSFLCGIVAFSGMAVANEARDGAEVQAQLGDRAGTTKQERQALKSLRSNGESASAENAPSKEANKTFRMTQEITIGAEPTEGANVDEAHVASYKSPVTYITTHEGVMHTVYSLSQFGDYVTLNDGLTWFVRPADRYKTGNFLVVTEYDYFLNTNFCYFTDNILILPGSVFSAYDYVLVNATTGETLEVDLVQPTPGQIVSSYTVLAIAGNTVYLQDGSIWTVPASDQGMLYRWYPGDSITIGINDGFFTGWNRNILINVNLNEYVRGNCIN
ncbi:MAG: hypothetical protein H0U49_08480 [Parachlamydiaceae bacterium]|nr:hypothetical protein [Parachlamydiaceae bacterium]